MKKYFGILVIVLSTIFLSFDTKEKSSIKSNQINCFRCNNQTMVNMAGRDSNKIHHIMQRKHAWSKIHANPTWAKVSKDILTVLNNGTKFQYKSGNGTYRKTYRIKGLAVDVIFFESSSGRCKLSDAWVRTR